MKSSKNLVKDDTAILRVIRGQNGHTIDPAVPVIFQTFGDHLQWNNRKEVLRVILKACTHSLLI